VEKITENVYFDSNICNHSLVRTADGVVLIDTPAFPSAAAIWRDAIVSRGESLRYVINTEPHLDHFGGDAFFDAPLVVHEGAGRAIGAASLDNYLQMIGPVESQKLPDRFSFRRPTIVFSGNLTLYVGDHAFRLLHLPGHTPYQTPVYVPEEKVLFAGDNVVNGMPLFHEAEPDRWLHSLDELMELDIDIVVPGHGSIGGKDLISRMKTEVAACIAVIAEAIKKGLTLDETLSAISFLDRYPEPAADPEKRSFFEKRSITRLYNALVG
jgi:cyclase